MDDNGEGAAPERKHVLNAAKAAGLPKAVGEQAIDELLGNATPQLLLELAKSLPLGVASVKSLHSAMQIIFARLAR